VKKEAALKIFNEVRENYDKIAEEFSFTREFSWEEVKSLAECVHIGDKVLDLGCGNGRLVDAFRGKVIEYAGIDNSEKLVEIAKKKHPAQDFHFFDGLRIPFEDNKFDAVFCIAVLHHVPGSQLRGEFLSEIRRVLKPGGKLILTVWYLWEKGRYWSLFFKFTLKKLFGKSGLDFFDIIEPWFKVAKRYLHLFGKGELKRLIKHRGFKINNFGILKNGPKNKNLLIVAVK
jgi:ubiquinone/menaquinone biosynthesis C-methylase UbiE